ncbi:glycosyltransferase family 4 protein [Porphyromonas sp. COT-239 OH1446]|uniref:glycosyltransferase family 4 protein n=1 Tax=Porphyromonas sp. COT-239 OH1446 TaxID=1515613 RepID=UPI00052E0048|nr:glycosyltransferase family 4 protein [Porphyromonas sp. COT-239 OH1446]KGN69998.1 glycosyl transferase family 1 [Porphyromonas sp. COT-239 OH1446]
MRIVYCIPALYNSGGMERVLTLKANYLVDQGYDLHIITTDQRGRKPFFNLDDRVQLYNLDINHEEQNGQGLWLKLRDYPLKRYRHEKRLKALLMRLRADVVVSMFGEEAFFLTKIQDGSRKVLEYHFSKLKRLQYGRRGLWRWVDLWRTRKDAEAVKGYDRFVVLTEEDRALWGELPNICVIPNPLPFEPQEQADTTSCRIIAAGRYDYQKNFEALLDIWAMIHKDFPAWRLDIYGDGPMRSLLEERLKGLGLGESLTLHPPTREIMREYLSSSIYVMTSRYEGLPMVLLEAQALGLPIVSYTCPCGPRDIVADGVNGYLVPEGREEEFAARLRLLMADEQLRRDMGRAAHEASSRYRMQTVMPQWLELFEALVRISKN